MTPASAPFATRALFISRLPRRGLQAAGLHTATLSGLLLALEDPRQRADELLPNRAACRHSAIEISRDLRDVILEVAASAAPQSADRGSRRSSRRCARTIDCRGWSMPITAHRSSTISVFTCVMPGWYSRMRTPALSSSPYMRRLASRTNRWSVVGPGDDRGDRHAARHVRVSNARRNALSGRKYGVLMRHRPFGAFDERLEQHTRGGGAIGGRALDHERRRCWPTCGQILVDVLAAQDLAAALEPVLGEDALDADTTGPSMRAIMSRQIGFPPERLHPPVGDAGAADERDVAVDDEQLAVGAVVQPCEAVPASAADTARRGSRTDAAGRRCTGSSPRLPIGVHDQRDAHAGPRPLGQRLDELVGDLPALEDVALHVHRLARAGRMASSIAG